MEKSAVVYLHGFASSDRGEKGRYFQDKAQDINDFHYLAVNFNPTPRDFRFLSITGMINRVRQFLLDHQVNEPLLIGSSLGGLVSLRYAELYPVRRMLLLAPLLAYQSLSMNEKELSSWKRKGTVEIDHYAFAGKLPLAYRFHQDALQYTEMVEPRAATQIIHGRWDETVPIEDSRYYAEKYSQQVSLLEVDSDHRLADQHDLIWEQVLEFLFGREP